MQNVQPKTVIPVANGLGECILWDEGRQQVLWTDMPGKTLYRYDPASGAIETRTFDEDLCSFALIDGSDDLLCAFQSGFAWLDPDSGNRTWLHRIANADKIRLNDGRVDRQGRFWCGSLVDFHGKGMDDSLAGELFCVDHDGAISKHLDGIGVSNSLCWSPDGSTMYFGDSAQKEIWAFDFDQAAGTISRKRLFATTPEPTSPDGSCVDADGFLWNAEWGQGRVVRYSPDGDVDGVLQLPVSHITCVAFGGRELTDLYVTTATFGLSDEQRDAEQQAGDVFVFDTPYRGLTECRFKRATS